MSGFKNLKDKEVEDAKVTKEILQGGPPGGGTPVEEAKKHRGDEYFAEEIAPITGEFGGIVGDDGTCKTAIILNSIQLPCYTRQSNGNREGGPKLG